MTDTTTAAETTAATTAETTAPAAEAAETKTEVSTTETPQGESAENKQADTANPTQGEQDAASKDGEKSEGEDKDAEGEDKPEGSGEFTDFTVPEGFEMNTEMLAKFTPVAQEAGLSQEQAQQFIDIHADAISGAINNPEFRESVYQDVHNTKMESWANSVIDDAALGGDNSKEALATAITAVEKLEVPGLMELVTDPDLGIGNHIKAVKFFEGLGRKIKSHGFESGGAGGQPSRAADVLYGNNQNNNE